MWLVAQTESQREQVAVHWLKQQRFEPYLPQIRLRRQAHERMVERLTPLFPSYVLVRGTDYWQPIRRTIAIIDVLHSGDHPAQLGDDVIGQIRARERNGVVVLPEPPRWRRGDPLRITGGIFRHHPGVWEGMRSHHRVAVLLTLLGSPRVVELDRRDIVRVR